MQKIEKIVLTYDFTRIVGGCHILRAYAHSLHLLLDIPLKVAIDKKIEVFPAAKDMDKFNYEFSKAQGVKKFENHEDWVEHYYAEPTDELKKLIFEKFKNSLVILFESLPLLEKAFIELDIPYVSFCVSPIRFLDEIKLCAATNFDTVRQILNKYKLHEIDIQNASNQLRARYLLENYQIPLHDNSVLIIGQTKDDHVLIQRNKTISNLLNYKEQISFLYDKYNHVYFKPHPRGTERRIIDYFKKEKKTTVLEKDEDKDIYKLLCHKSIKAVAGLNSSVLVESNFFDKIVYNFIDFKYNFLEKNYDRSARDSYILSKDLFNPPFWQDLYESLTGIKLATPKKIQFYSAPNIYSAFNHSSYTDDTINNLYSRVEKIEEEQKKSNIMFSHLSTTAEDAQTYENAKVHVGCGDVVKDGYVSCYIRDTGNTDIVCEAWNIHKYFTNSEEIYSRHMIEHLSFDLVEKTLSSWYASLKVGGKAVILFPDLDDFLERMKKVQWKADEWRNRTSFTRHTMAFAWGWQRDDACTKGTNINELNYWDVHKSGFNEESFTFLMRSVGFTDIEKHPNEFGFIGYKRMDNFERQISMYPEKIRWDHTGRYRFVKKYVSENDKILDIACGIGYGSYILANETPCSTIDSVDIDSYAIKYAKEFYQHTKIQFTQENAVCYQSSKFFDLIVSFETIEHVEEIDLLLQNLYSQLKANGVFICSTPNECTFPFNLAHTPYHVRHYTPKEFKDLLEMNGFTVELMYSQYDRYSEEISHDCNGLYLIAVCRKNK